MTEMNKNTEDLIKKMLVEHAELVLDSSSVMISTARFEQLVEAETAVKIIVHARDTAEANWDIGATVKKVCDALWPLPIAVKAPAPLPDVAAPIGPADGPENSAVPTPTPIEEMGPTEDPFAVPTV